MKNAPHPVLIAGLAWGVLAHCGCRFSPRDPNTDDTPTWGRAVILADVDARPVIQEEAEVFSAIYPNTHLVIHYLGESELMRAMLHDSVRCAVASATPGAEQQAWFDKHLLKAPVVPIYTDAIAAVVDTASTLRQLTVADIRKLLTPDTVLSILGKDTEIRMLGMKALFAGRGSGVARALADSLHLNSVRGRALPDVDAVIGQAARDPQVVGLIPFAAISDLDNPAMRALRANVRLLPVARSAGSPAVLPSQSTIADGSYPLRRTMTMILTEGKSGLGTGFVSFVANHKGQRIILKLGVVPVRIPTRNVEVVHGPIPTP